MGSMSFWLTRNLTVAHIAGLHLGFMGLMWMTLETSMVSEVFGSMVVSIGAQKAT